MTLINGSPLDNTLNGTAAADTINGLGGDDVLRGLAGNDILDGGANYDRADYNQDFAAGGLLGVNINLLTGVGIDGFGNTDTLINIESVRGTNLADSFLGSNRTDETEQFWGLGGNDTINGGGGGDEARYDADANFGGAGAVSVNLASGFATDGFGAVDTLIGIENARGTLLADIFVGSAFNNQFRGLGGADYFDGGAGFDTLRYDSDASFTGGAAGITVTFTGFGAGTVIDGFGATDSFINIEAIRATLIADRFIGGAGTEEFLGLAGNDTLIGGEGFDIARYDSDRFYAGGTSGVTVNLLTGVAIDGFGNTDSLSGMEGVIGTSFNDNLTGDAQNNGFFATRGNDALNGGDGRDFISFGSDFDTGGPQGVVVNLATGVITDNLGGAHTTASVEEVRGTNLADSMTGSERSESFDGQGGNDTLRGGDGSDFLTGGAGNDVIDGTAGPAGDQSAYDNDWASFNDGGVIQGANVNLSTGVAIDGFGNTDTLIDIERVRGTSLNDSIIGSATQNLRNERFAGLAGADTLNGQTGFDTAVYNNDVDNGGLGGVFVDLTAGTAIDGFGTTDTLIAIEAVIATKSNDYLIGSAANNSFRPLGGNDTIFGQDGELDTVSLYFDDQIGGAGSTIDLGAGTGTLAAGGTLTLSGIEAVDGSLRNDMITGSTGANNLFGDLGADTIIGGDGDDTINGGAGADSLVGGNGSDWLGFVFDTTDPAASAADAAQNAAFGWLAQNWNWTGVNVNLATGIMSGFDGAVDSFSGFENLFGTYYNDTLTGDGGDNRFRGYAGNDTINGAGGTDTVTYAPTYSRYVENFSLALKIGDTPNGVNVNLQTGVALDGNGGTDTLTSIENITGSIGNDTILGNGDANVFTGGLGNDSLSGAGGADTLTGEDGNDTLDGGSGNDFLTGGLGDDTYVVDSNLDGIVEVFGQGVDTVLSTAAFTQLDASFTLENLTYTGAGPGTLFGNSANNVLTGNGSGNNFNGFFGADTMIGGSGDDFFYIDATDQVTGGAGYDSVYVQTALGTSINVGAAQVEFVVGGTGDDTLDGSTASVALALIAGAGADVMRGGSANDFIYIDSFDAIIDAGGGTNDVIVVTGTPGVNLDIAAANGEYILGGTGADTLNGAGSANALVIQGGGGADSITGGNNNDLIYGNAGADIFRVTANAQFDVIFDFADTGGVDDDRIDVRGLGAAFDTLAEILAVTTDYPGSGSVITFTGGNSLYVYLVPKANLTADDFLF